MCCLWERWIVIHYEKQEWWKYMHTAWCDKIWGNVNDWNVRKMYVCGDWAPWPETELGRESQVWPFIWYIYMRARVRSETKLGRESQEWPQLYKEKLKYERKREEKKKKQNLCETCVMCVDNSGQILTCINMHCYTIFVYIHGIVILYICCWMWELCYELNVRTLVVKDE